MVRKALFSGVLRGELDHGTLELRKRWGNLIVGQVSLPRLTLVFGQLEGMNDADPPGRRQRERLVAGLSGRPVFERSKRGMKFTIVVIHAPDQAHRHWQQNGMHREQLAPPLDRPGLLADHEVFEPERLGLDHFAGWHPVP